MPPNERLRLARQLRGLSGYELARRVGVSRDVVRRWEKGEVNPCLGSLARLCRALEVSADWVLGLED